MICLLTATGRLFQQVALKIGQGAMPNDSIEHGWRNRAEQ